MPEAITTPTTFSHAVVTGEQETTSVMTLSPKVMTGKAAVAGDLVGLCAQHIANREALESCPLEADESPHWPPFAATSEAISTARPMNLAELAAKARAAKREAQLPSGGEDVCNGSALEWAWDLVNDLIRLDSSAQQPSAG